MQPTARPARLLLLHPLRSPMRDLGVLDLSRPAKDECRFESPQ